MAHLSRRSFFGGLLAATSVAALGVPKVCTPQRHVLNVGVNGQPFATISEAMRRANQILSAEPHDHVTIMLLPGSHSARVV